MGRDVELEKDRARYGLLAVIISNLAIAGTAVFGVWQLDGDTSVIVGVLTAAFTAVSSTTTAYLGIKRSRTPPGRSSCAATRTTGPEGDTPGPRTADATRPDGARLPRPNRRDKKR